MNTNSDDILLLKLIKQGDQIAFRHLFYQYADSLERFITYYIHDREKSQDLVLDIFTYIWENRQNFEIKLTLKAYLFQAARNKSFTYIRDKKIPVYLEEMEGMEIVQNYDSELELQELHHLIEEAVSLLPDKCREIFRKSREENLTNKEIAGQLHISEKTVEGQITIALKKIRIHKASIRFRHRPIQTNYIHVFAKTTIILSYPPVYRFKPICYGMIVAVLYYLHLS